MSGTFEACAEFGGPGDGSPVCAGCGWLETEHDHGGAEVRALPVRRAKHSGAAPRRLAS
ncbi:MAG TPA: hypothetical protein VGP92_06100 [Acidimicrobiia bacterium]|nr:hypothetical protein [Acidimicrobiia bacterium]